MVKKFQYFFMAYPFMVVDTRLAAMNPPPSPSYPFYSRNSSITGANFCALEGHPGGTLS